MTALATALRRAAEQLAPNLATEAVGLARQHADLKARVAAVEERMRRLAETETRVRTYVPQADGVYHCPACWVLSGARNPVHPRSSNDHLDRFGCGTCAWEAVIDPYS